MRNVRFDRRADVPVVVQVVMPALAIVGGLAFGAVVLVMGDHSVVEAYAAMWDASFGTPAGFEQTLVRATPLILAALAVTVALRMGVWNMGAEGQMALGAIGATFAAFQFADLPNPWLTIAMFGAGVIGAGLWALVAAIPRALIGLNEIITTLFLNYVGLLLLSALINGPWKDSTVTGFAYSRPLPSGAALPAIGTGGLTVGILIAIAVVVLCWWFLNRTRTGFSISIAGGNMRAADYLGMSVRRRIVGVLVLAGAVAGIAGVIQLMTSSGRLQDGLTGGYGYTAILVTFLARRRVGPTVVVAVAFAGLLTGAAALQSTGIPSAIALIVQAVIIIFVLAGDVLSEYRIRFGRAGSPEVEPVREEDAIVGGGR
ncbi:MULTISPECIES: ABC transporter permease [unclassified Mycolicibacterium]|uniref:ABC transporter permease n=1 Tax=unclassified Mycolicibacterium TaxID=2636767 RepID=UPI0012DE25D6|nr:MULTISPECIES: ABC transporter permease [unclassified Mycolicibacterium]MUL80680.1 ABC transporter permease [Mycolicibacterium sp. CBMA 329]MUL86447.1 ABC transporter permease [Mycolicibacterium sp. CBMA 331]MUM01309.1 ABC transporter permease [Mycolicibacterium sp. CBMA 334]MUM29045.1 ABC transporter permease [Mycolicibacterium sp. CBMA 295]MUM36743.1 ABC transporter permease [Mycolicibacterium sp. CBMA 247]